MIIRQLAESYLSDGTSTVKLQGEGAHVDRYTPQAPRQNETLVESAGDGGELADAPLRNFTEPTHITFNGCSREEARERRRDIQRIFKDARAWQMTGVGSPVYHYVRLVGTDDLYRSEVLSGETAWDDESLGEQHATGQYGLAVDITRRYYWEAAEELLVVEEDQIENHADYILIPETLIQGDLPATLRLAMTNDYAAQVHTIYVSHNYRSTPALFAPQLAAISGIAGPSELDISYWTWSGLQLGYAAGNSFRPMARFTTKPADTWYRWSMKFRNSVLWLGDLFQPDGGDLCLMGPQALRLPPWPLGDDTPHEITLHLSALRPDGEAGVALQAAYLMPLDGWREYVTKAFGLSGGTRLVDNGATGTITTDGWLSYGGGEAGNYIGFGQPILLQPAVKQRLNFLWETDADGGSDPNATLTVSAWVRHRKSSLL